MKQRIKVHKLDNQGKLVWSYQGTLLEMNRHERILEAFFDRQAVHIGSLWLKPGFRMVEYFYSDRWFNIFEIYNQRGIRQGWYCNIARPAKFSDGAIHQQDLALDLVVHPNGETELLDMNEFNELPLSEEERGHALAALDTLNEMISERSGPFKPVAPDQ